MAFAHMSSIPFKFTRGALSTIRSPDFCELVLELGKLPSQFNSRLEHWGDWGNVDRFFEERWGEREDFRLIIRTGKLYDRETFEAHAKESFPLSTKRGCIRFETLYSIDRYWR